MMRGVRRPAAALLIVGVLAASLVLCLPGVSTAAVVVGQGARTDGPVGPGYTYGGLVTTTVESAGGGWPVPVVTCGVSAYYVVGTGGGVAVQASADCAGNWVLTGGTWMNGPLDEQFGGSLTFAGPGCGQSLTLTDWQTTGTTSSVSGCGGVGEVCLSWSLVAQLNRDLHGGPDCAPLDMGAPPGSAVVDLACGDNRVVEPYIDHSGIGGDGRIDQWQTDITTDQAGWWAMYIVVEYPVPAPTGGGAHNVFSVLSGLSADRRVYLPHGDTGGAAAGVPFNLAGSTTSTRYSLVPYEEDADYVFPVVGYGILRVPDDLAATPAGRGTAQQLPQTEPRGLAGINDPEHCSWYWGEKIAETDDDTDEPIPMSTGDGSPGEGSETPPAETTPPAPPDSGDCNFSMTDPSSWLEGGMCAAVGLLGRILGLIGDLIGAVVGLPAALIDLLDGLLIPSDGFIEDQFDGVQDAWSDTPPMVYADGLTDVVGALSIPEPSGCDGPALNFSSPVGGQAVSLHPLSACGQYVAPVADLVKTALTVVVYVGAVLGAVRIVSSSLGVEAPRAGE